jgi:hypothetical protein
MRSRSQGTLGDGITRPITSGADGSSAAPASPARSRTVWGASAIALRRKAAGFGTGIQDLLGARVQDRRRDRRHRALRPGHHSARGIRISGGRPKRRAGLARRAARRRGAAERCGRVSVGAARAFRARRPRPCVPTGRIGAGDRARARGWERLTSGVRSLRPWRTGASIRLSWWDGPAHTGPTGFSIVGPTQPRQSVDPGGARMEGRRQPGPTEGRVGWPGALALRGARGAHARARSRGPCARRCSRRPPAGRRWGRCPLRA